MGFHVSLEERMVFLLSITIIVSLYIILSILLYIRISILLCIVINILQGPLICFPPFPHHPPPLRGVLGVRRRSSWDSSWTWEDLLQRESHVSHDLNSLNGVI